jgi:signal peptidase II|tara:strand:+ start:1589 stop:2089 length:501 start_codon:yes stop_codon:yes gene_type:complete
MNFINEVNNFKSIFFKKQNVFLVLIIFIIFTLDRFSKIKIINNLNDRVYFVNDFINLELIWNTGIGFGFLSTETELFYNLITLLVGLVILGLLYSAFISINIDNFIYSIIIGGACGNLYDRLIYKAVPDFIDFHYNNFHWFTFNVADIFITSGIIIFIIRSFFVKN